MDYFFTIAMKIELLNSKLTKNKFKFELFLSNYVQLPLHISLLPFILLISTKNADKSFRFKCMPSTNCQLTLTLC